MMENASGYRTNRERVLDFLRERPARKFRAAEIARSTAIDQNSVNPVLARLREEGVVDHQRPYWWLAGSNDAHPAPVEPDDESCVVADDSGFFESIWSLVRKLSDGKSGSQ